MVQKKLPDGGPSFDTDTQVAIYVPTLSRDDELLKRDLVEAAKSKVSKQLTELFGGASRKEYFIGSFEHTDKRFVEEEVVRVWSGAKKEDRDKTYKKVRKLAQEIAEDLCQKSVTLEWDSQLEFVLAGERKGTVKTKPFDFLPEDTQTFNARLVLRRLKSVGNIPYVLSLDRWKRETEKSVIISDVEKVCVKGKRAAYISGKKLSRPTRKQLARRLNPKDLVFDQIVTGTNHVRAIRVWMKVDGALRGGRELPLIGPRGTIPLVSVHLTLSLLGSSLVDPLRDSIDRSAVTARFFNKYAALKDRIGNYNQEHNRLNEEDAHREAQLLLGRLMFLHFLEHKGWLENERAYLKKAFKSQPIHYYKRFLEPLFFDILDVDYQDRTKPSTLPFLNGGLFRPPEDRSLDYPDDLFDPEQSDSILNVFGQYEFTMDEHTTSDDLVSIDPSMFGRVLESLCNPGERKGKGVHYTPVHIGQTLAFESIVRRLADKTDIDFRALRRFAKGDTGAITDDDSERVKVALHELRIVDPAVGSGSLLLSALTVLMEILTVYYQKWENPLTKGGKRWAKKARRFVRESLFGVDIDPLAVEVTKLRLWLAIAVGEKKSTPLPDLDYNIRVGDSLSNVEEKAVDREVVKIRVDDSAYNDFIAALRKYKTAGSETARTAADELEKAEREYLAHILEEKKTKTAQKKAAAILDGAPLPFYWRVHFADVFTSENDGFDIVIANPPYVRVQALRKHFSKQLPDYKERFTTIRKGAKDLYLPFVEQALSLAGNGGRIAYIMPNFSRTKTAGPLRALLNEHHTVDLWVDFGDIQVFKSSTNYVALLFAQPKRGRRKYFDCKVVTDSTDFHKEPHWLDTARSGRVKRETLWRTGTRKDIRFMELLEKGNQPLVDFTDIGVGVQTSADAVFLLKHEASTGEGGVEVFSKHLKQTVRIELEMLRPCAKGSVHLKPYHVIREKYLLWPYDDDNQLFSADELSTKYPLAWNYLNRCSEKLKGREKGKFDDDKWWRFGRSQGLSRCGRKKIIIPSAMKGATAVLDHAGVITMTASGKGGGGAYGLILKDESIHPRWLLAVLNSSTLWKWLSLEGDPKKGGWRGVDKALLERIPIPVPSPEVQQHVSDLTVTVEKLISRDEDTHEQLAKIDQIVAKAYGVKLRKS